MTWARRVARIIALAVTGVALLGACSGGTSGRRYANAACQKLYETDRAISKGKTVTNSELRSVLAATDPTFSGVLVDKPQTFSLAWEVSKSNCQHDEPDAPWGPIRN